MEHIISRAMILFTLVSSVFILLFFAGHLFQKFFRRKIKIVEKISKIMAEKYILLGFFISLAALLGSLFYSEIMLYAPCTLCWYQRIFIYPQVLIFGLALLWKDKKAVNYLIALSIAGGLIALYHSLLQSGIILKESFICAPNTVSCFQTYFVYYGFITIPIMSLIIFILLIILGVNFKKFNSQII